MDRKIVLSALGALGALVALPLVGGIVFAAVNWRDAAPSAEARALTATLAARPVVADADNGYLDALGFAAQAGVEPHALGLERRAWLRARQPSGDASAPVRFPRRDVDPRDALEPAMRGLLDACRMPERACIAALATRGARTPLLPGALRPITERYRVLLTRTGWREEPMTDVAAPLPGYQHLLTGQQAHMLATLDMARGGDAAMVRERLQADAVFWRGVLGDADSLVAKLIAATAVERNARWSVLAIGTLPPEVRAGAVPASLAIPLTVRERSLRLALAGEWAGTRRMVATMEGGQETLAYKPQDTANRMAAAFVALASASELPVDRVRTASRQVADDAPRRGPWLYNPAGRILADIARPAYIDYAVRIGDVESARAAAHARAGLLVADIAPDAMANALAAGLWRDAYTRRPFGWDAAHRCVPFVRARAERGASACIEG